MRQLFLIRYFQLMYIERIVEIEKSPFGKHHSNNCFTQESSLKLVGGNMMRNRIFIWS